MDFKERAKALWKQLGQGGGALGLAAVETALREAYAEGTRGGAPKPATTPRKAAAAPTVAAPAECEHEWDEAFLDGRGVGQQCRVCGVLERDVQARCNHYFVAVSGRQVCVACRKTKST